MSDEQRGYAGWPASAVNGAPQPAGSPDDDPPWFADDVEIYEAAADEIPWDRPADYVWAEPDAESSAWYDEDSADEASADDMRPPAGLHSGTPQVDGQTAASPPRMPMDDRAPAPPYAAPVSPPYAAAARPLQPAQLERTYAQPPARPASTPGSRESRYGSPIARADENPSAGRKGQPFAQPPPFGAPRGPADAWPQAPDRTASAAEQAWALGQSAPSSRFSPVTEPRAEPPMAEPTASAADMDLGLRASEPAAESERSVATESSGSAQPAPRSPLWPPPPSVFGDLFTSAPRAAAPATAPSAPSAPAESLEDEAPSEPEMEVAATDWSATDTEPELEPMETVEPGIDADDAAVEVVAPDVELAEPVFAPPAPVPASEPGRPAQPGMPARPWASIAQAAAPWPMPTRPTPAAAPPSLPTSSTRLPLQAAAEPVPPRAPFAPAPAAAASSGTRFGLTTEGTRPAESAPPALGGMRATVAQTEPPSPRAAPDLAPGAAAATRPGAVLARHTAQSQSPAAVTASPMPVTASPTQRSVAPGAAPDSSDAPTSSAPAAASPAHAAPAAQPAAAAGQPAEPTRAALASPAADDELWFLAPQPNAEGSADASAAEDKEPSTISTWFWTGFVALFVIVLVLAFLHFLTGVFR